MLKQLLQSGKAKIVIVEPLASRRSMLLNGLKTLKVGTFTAYASMREFWAVLEAGDSCPDWVVTPVCVDQPINVFHLLQLGLSQVSLRTMRVSLFVDPSECGALPGAYALGLASHHRKSADVMSQLATLSELLAPETPADDCLMAAHYLRHALIDLRSHDERLKLEQTLVTLYPDQNGVLLEFALALAACGRQMAAMSIAARVVNAKTQELSSRARALMERLVNDDRMTGGQYPEIRVSATATRWDLRQAVVVDPDEAARNLLVTALRELGINDVNAFADGQTVWQWLDDKAAKVDLIVMEWRLPSKSGEALVRNLRQERRVTMPIVIFSSLVKTTDRPALREFGVTDVIEKPLPPKQLAALIASIIEQDRRPQGLAAFERRVRLAAEAKNLPLAKQLFAELKTTHQATEAQLKGLEAELAFLASDYRKTVELALQAMAETGEDIVLLNLIGKAFLRLRRPKEATKFLERAQALSPNNMERLCHLAEAHIDGDDHDKAAQTLTQAAQLGDTPELATTQAKLALATGAVDRMRELALKVRDPSQLVAFINNRAIGLTEERRFGEAIQIYETALQSLADDVGGLHSLIRYNLALARIKNGTAEAAISDLQVAAGGASPEVAKKVQSLLKRLVAAVRAGKPLVLRTDDRMGKSDPRLGIVPTGEPERHQGLEPGKHACHLVYVCDLATDPLWGPIAGKLPRFKLRGSGLASGQ